MSLRSLMPKFTRQFSFLTLIALAVGCQTQTTPDPQSGVFGKVAVPECTADSDCVSVGPCGQATCVANVCKAGLKAEGSPCNDGNACNAADKCGKDGQCVGDKSSKKCDDSDVCTVDGCDPAIGCVYTVTPAKCDDLNDCTTDTCDKVAGCKHENNTAPCDDSDGCTIADACTAGKCAGGGAKVCDDKNPCTDDLCDKAIGCTGKNNTIDCDDGNLCTKGDSCLDGLCRAGKPLDCDDSNGCTSDACDAKKGCTNTALTGTACDDADACTAKDACSTFAGPAKCVGAPVDCDDKNACTDDSCDKAKGCKHANNAAKCDDGSLCTEGDVCALGACVAGKAKNCDDGNVCTADSCSPKEGCQLAAAASACDDANACTSGDACKDSACVAGALDNCDDGNPCTTDSCAPIGGCKHENNTAPCDDKNPATNNDVCSAGACGGVIPPTCEGMCDKVQASCGDSGPNSQFASKAACVDFCKNLGKYPLGKTGDVSGNSVGCRTYHAGVAGKDAASATLHCPHTGKFGGSTCGTPCENYCNMTQSNCTGVSELYKNPGDCNSTCVKQTVGTDSSAVEGNTLMCMMNHVALAGKDAVTAGNECPSGGIPNTLGGKCVAAATCDDKIKNGNENDVDCGGSCPLKCGDTKGCGLGTDCVSGVCTLGKCQAPACNDKLKNGNETDTDCGGTCGATCALLAKCAIDNDCASKNCAAKICAAAVVLPKTYKVVASDFKFTPADLAIAAGDSVEFTTPGNHNVVEVDKATWDASGSTPKNGGFSVGFGAVKTIAFPAAGVYYYVCSPHAGMGMIGKVTVQ